MNPITASDVCQVCYDESQRTFVYKKCCSLLLCRSCLTNMMLTSFPDLATCPGCRAVFTCDLCNCVTVGSQVLPCAPCNCLLLIKEHETVELCVATHMKNCVPCLQKLVRNNHLFQQKVGQKFNGLKRKYSVLKDEVFVRNTRIRELLLVNNELSTQVRLLQRHCQQQHPEGRHNVTRQTQHVTVEEVASLLRERSARTSGIQEAAAAAENDTTEESVITTTTTDTSGESDDGYSTPTPSPERTVAPVVIRRSPRLARVLNELQE